MCNIHHVLKKLIILFYFFKEQALFNPEWVNMYFDIGKHFIFGNIQEKI